MLTTAGGIVVTALLDGTIVALDDQTLEELWKINVGTGFNAPPMTYSVDGKQYIAIASGLWRNAKNKLEPLAGDADRLAGDGDLGVSGCRANARLASIRAGPTLHSGDRASRHPGMTADWSCLRGTALNSNAQYLSCTVENHFVNSNRTWLSNWPSVSRSVRGSYWLWPFFRR